MFIFTAGQLFSKHIEMMMQTEKIAAVEIDNRLNEKFVRR
jgi:hypothetical protein